MHAAVSLFYFNIIFYKYFLWQGKYCPTTCGIADYMFKYLPDVNRELDSMQNDLELIANLTEGADETITYMKDSTVSAQKSTQPGKKKDIKMSS